MAARGGPGGGGSRGDGRPGTKGHGEGRRPLVDGDDAPSGDPSFDEVMGELGVRQAPPAAERVTPKAPGRLRAGGVAHRPPARRGVPSSDDGGDVPEEVADVVSLVRGVARARRGAPPAARGPVIDLHGFSVVDAVAELRRFVVLWSGAADTLRVVTGRGRATGEAPVREAAERWLASSPLVLEMRRGAAGEGGDGVLVVRLRGPRGGR